MCQDKTAYKEEKCGMLRQFWWHAHLLLHACMGALTANMDTERVTQEAFALSLLPGGFGKSSRLGVLQGSAHTAGSAVQQ